MPATNALTPLLEDLSLAYRWRPATGPAAGLLVLLHGVGSNENSLLGLVDYLPKNMAVALVRSPLTMAPGAYSAFAVSFAADGPRIDAVAAENSRQMLRAFVDELQARSGIAPTRTLIAGFSQGGIMAASLALTAPGCVAGFAILSGRILPEIMPLLASTAALRRLHALVVHGVNDDRLPLFWAQRSSELLTRLGVAHRSLHYAMGHELTPQVAHDFGEWVAASLAP